MRRRSGRSVGEQPVLLVVSVGREHVRVRNDGSVSDFVVGERERLIHRAAWNAAVTGEDLPEPVAGVGAFEPRTEDHRRLAANRVVLRGDELAVGGLEDGRLSVCVVGRGAQGSSRLRKHRALADRVVGVGLDERARIGLTRDVATRVVSVRHEPVRVLGLGELTDRIVDSRDPGAVQELLASRPAEGVVRICRDVATCKLALGAQTRRVISVRRSEVARVLQRGRAAHVVVHHRGVAALGVDDFGLASVRVERERGEVAEGILSRAIPIQGVVRRGRDLAPRVLRRDGVAHRIVRKRRAVAEGILHRRHQLAGVVDGRGPEAEWIDRGGHHSICIIHGSPDKAKGTRSGGCLACGVVSRRRDLTERVLRGR